MPLIASPNSKIIKQYLKKWKTLESYKLQESSLKKLFTKTYPNNTDLDDILIKVCSLNDFYSTNIFQPFNVAKHILKLKIDKHLKQNDEEIVNRIAVVKVGNNQTRNFYSFATKYCSHHKPEEYPIYDSFVEKMLMNLKKKDKFAKFNKQDLKDFKKYKQILLNFKAYYKLENFSLKQIDQYLWLAGKEYFPKKY